jgi:hypothetical protein
MEKFDSLIYGNGLNLNLFTRITREISLNSYSKQYLDFGIFLKDLLTNPTHSSIWRDFEKKFDDHGESANKTRFSTRNKLYNELDEILALGFEQWVSKYTFIEPSKITSIEKTFLYLAFNHWASLIDTNVFNRKNIEYILQEYADKLNSKVNNNQIYTLNFDTYFDKFLKVRHLHGRFVSPLRKFSSVLLSIPGNEVNHEYTYLFGGNGFEKKSRINTLMSLQCDTYDFNFFNDNSDLGNVLIYGVAFGKTQFMTDDFLNEHNIHYDNFLVRSVDGHILERLSEKYKDNKLSSITITYYDENDYKRISKWIDISGLKNFTKLISLNEYDLLE